MGSRVLKIIHCACLRDSGRHPVKFHLPIISRGAEIGSFLTIFHFWCAFSKGLSVRVALQQWADQTISLVSEGPHLARKEFWYYFSHRIDFSILFELCFIFLYFFFDVAVR